MRKKNLVAAAATTLVVMLATSAPAMAQEVDFDVDDDGLDYVVSYDGLDETELLYLGYHYPYVCYYPYLDDKVEQDFDGIDLDDNDFDGIDLDDGDVDFVVVDDFDQNDRQDNKQDRRDDRQNDRKNNKGSKGKNDNARR